MNHRPLKRLPGADRWELKIVFETDEAHMMALRDELRPILRELSETYRDGEAKFVGITYCRRTPKGGGYGNDDRAR